MAVSQTSLSVYLRRWEEAFARGEELTPEQLSDGQPELVESLRHGIRLLRQMRGLSTVDAGPERSVWETVAPSDKPAPDPSTVTVAPGDVPPYAGDSSVPAGYEILEEIGRGGMGVVYRARQLALNRVVALKMILHSGHAGHEARLRFLAEAEAVAKVRHPGIVQVYDFGTTSDGLPYYSLEMCEGGSLSDRLRASPLPPAEAARVVEQVSHAVHAAHDAGIVHRDLKPGNVLIDGDNKPRVSDFGLAKRTEGGGQTVTGAVVGTPSYMAPEQAQGKKEVGPPADVWALGAILYECLSGRPPFRAATLLETLAQVIHDEPVPLRQLQSRVPADLETICHKCLQKDPARRYASAHALADDLRRFGDGQPIKARPPTFGYLASKYARRYRVPLALTAALLVLIGGGTLAAFVQIRKERNDAVDAKYGEEKKAKEADEARAETEKRTNEATVLREVVEQASSSVQEDQIRHFAGLSPVQEELAAIRLEGLQKLLKNSPDDETLLPRLARAHAVLGRVSMDVGSFQRATVNLGKAIEQYDALAKQQPERREYVLLRCQTLNELAFAYWQDRRRPLGRPHLDEALRLIEAEQKKTPDDAEVNYLLARTLAMLASNVAGEDNPARARYAERGGELFEKLVGKKYREADARLGVALCRYHVVFARFDGKNQAGLLKDLDGIKALEQSAIELLPDSPYLTRFAVFTHVDRADALTAMGKWKEALAETESAVAVARRRVKLSPELSDAKSTLVHALYNHAWALRRNQRHADVQAAFDEITLINDGLVGRHPDWAGNASDWVYYRNQAVDYLEYGPKSKGEIATRQEMLRVLDQTLERGRELSKRFPEHRLLQVNVAKTLHVRGRYDNEAKRYAQALPFLLESIATYRDRVLPISGKNETADVVEYLTQIESAVQCARELKKPDEILRLAELASAAKGKATTRPAIDNLGTIFNVAAAVQIEAGRDDDAARRAREVVAVCRPAFDKATWHYYLRSRLASAYKTLADVAMRKKDFAAEVAARREFVRLNTIPMHGGNLKGVKIADLLDTTSVADEAEAERLRDVIKKAEKGYKRFTVPCDFGGVKYPFHIYVADPIWPTHPLADQARWLQEERGGTLPKEVMESFEKLHKIAHENNVSFQDLCVYALGTAAAEGGGGVQVREAGAPDLTAEKSARPTGDELSKLRADLVDVKKQLDNAPNDAKLTLRAAQLHDALGNAHEKDKFTIAARDNFADSVRLYEALARGIPREASFREALARVYLSFGRTQMMMLDYERAFATFHRRLDLLEHLRGEKTAAPVDPAIAATYAALGALSNKRGEDVDAVRWFVRAVRGGNQDGARLLGERLQFSNQMSSLLPLDLLRAYQEALKNSGGASSPGFLTAFQTAALAAAQKPPAPTDVAARIERSRAARSVAIDYALMAKEYLDDGKKDKALAARRKQVKTLLDATKAAPADVLLKIAYERAVYETAELCVECEKGLDAASLLREAQAAGVERAGFKLADLYEEGRGGLKEDRRHAATLRGNIYFARGTQFYQQGKYADAQKNYEASAKWRPTVGSYQRIGWCLRYQQKYAEAIRPFREGLEAAEQFNTSFWLVFDWINAALSANRPDDALAAFEMLERRKWSAEQTTNPYSVERELAGLKALTLIVAGKDATAAVKAFKEIAARPNMHSEISFRPVFLETWKKEAKPPQERIEAALALVNEMAAPSPDGTSPYLPLKTGAAWHYKMLGGGTLTMRVGAREAIGERRYYKVVRSIDKKLLSAEHLAVYADGAYEQNAGTTPLVPHAKTLALPPKDGRTWKSATKVNGVELTFVGSMRVEDVKVPAGEYKGAFVVELKTMRGDAVTFTRTTWYAKEVGPVKIVTKDAKDVVQVMELEKTEAAPKQ